MSMAHPTVCPECGQRLDAVSVLTVQDRDGQDVDVAQVALVGLDEIGATVPHPDPDLQVPQHLYWAPGPDAPQQQLDRSGSRCAGSGTPA